MNKVKVKTKENSLVHYDRGRDLDALCGLYLLGDPGLDISEAVPTKLKVNCPQCLEIVNLCKNIKENHISIQYAEENAIDFAEWINNIGFQKYKEGWCQSGGSNGWHCTTKELYQIYLKENEK